MVEAPVVLGGIAYGAALYALARPSAPAWAATAFAVWAAAGTAVVVAAGALTWRIGGQQAAPAALLAVSLDLAVLAVLQGRPNRLRHGERS